jgi:hypothetical protein
MGIGQDLLAVPFPDMVYNLARAIADGQKKLDKNSLNTLKELARTKFDFIESITEVLMPVPQVIETPQGELTVTGIEVQTTIAPPTKLTLLQAGLTPTFYQFTESLIEVKIQLKSTLDNEVKVDSGFEFDQTLGVEMGFGGGLGSLFGGPSGKITSTTHVASHTNVEMTNKYSVTQEGSSLLRTTLRPVPPPQRVMPRFITVNALITPPQVTIGQ